MMSKSLLLAHLKSSLSTDGAGNQLYLKYLLKRKKQTYRRTEKYTCFVYFYQHASCLIKNCFGFPDDSVLSADLSSFCRHVRC